MAQGVIISFIANPNEGDRVQYTASISGIPIVYNNGLNKVDFEFTNNDLEVLADPLHRVKIGATTEDTAQNVKLFFENNGYSTSIYTTYVKYFSGTIWNTYSNFYTDDVIYFDMSLDVSDPFTVSMTSFADSSVPTTAPKYFFEYYNIANVFFRVEIYQKNFAGSATEITGRAIIQKVDVNGHFDPIRGTGVSLQLEANENLTFSDLYGLNETDYTVKLYRDLVLVYQGFLKPDGIFESFTDNIWNINLQCVDGLGFLDNLAFVKPDGSQFTGKMSVLDVIYNCLKRTGLQLKINTYVNLFYYGIIDEDANTDPLAEIMIDTARFIKDDDNTAMSCREVLLSMLFNAVITQEFGEWFIYRPSDFYTNTYPQFKRYEIDGSYIGLNTTNVNQILGSDIEGFYPCHCNKNQQIQIQGAVSAFRLSYKYGFINSLLPNGNLKHDPGTVNYEGWTFTPWTESKANGSLITDITSDIGIKFISGAPEVSDTNPSDTALISDQSEELLKDFTFDVKLKATSYGFPVRISVKVILVPTDLSPNWELLIDGSWTLSNGGYSFATSEANPNTTGELVNQQYEITHTVSAKPLPFDGKVFMFFNVPIKQIKSPYDGALTEIKSAEIINTFQGNNIVGEFHNVNRISKVSSIVKDNKIVASGDNNNKIYKGAFYMANGTDLTQNWHRGLFPAETSQEVKPLLRILAEDELRIASKPLKIFSGDIYGYLNYMSVIDIKNIGNKFMPISWSYDTFNNVTSCKSLELYYEELSDMTYEKQNDYGETVKPTIVS